MTSQLLENLIQSLSVLPTIGKKTARRLAIHLLTRESGAIDLIASALLQAKEIKQCTLCRRLSDTLVCDKCESTSSTKMVVVEHDIDVYAMGDAGFANNHYFVLHGVLSPLDGIGEEALGLDLLKRRCSELVIEELVIATSATVEGEATAFSILEMCGSPSMNITRLAFGLPVGGELEYVDRHTIVRAMEHRQSIEGNR